MSSSQSSQSNQSSGGSSQGQSGQGKARTGLDDLTYDLVTVLHEKAKGLEAYDRYLADAQSSPEARQLLEQIRQADLQHVEKLRTCLSSMLGGSGNNRGQSQ